MSDQMHEPIYSQADMNNVLAQMKELQQQRDHVQQLLWGAVSVAGGSLNVPYRIWEEGQLDRQLVMRDDFEHQVIQLKLADPSPDNEE